MTQQKELKLPARNMMQKIAWLIKNDGINKSGLPYRRLCLKADPYTQVLFP
jgi:hypothetical protein